MIVASAQFAYFAPEQKFGEPATPSSDQYSLGLVVYEILTGRFLLDKLKAGPTGNNPSFPGPRERRVDLSSEMNVVIQRATALNPAERYSDVVAFVTAFHQAGGTTVEATIGESDRSQAPIPNPYKGLRAFQQADAADFFGREALIKQLLTRMRGVLTAGRFLAVVGPSGSGKSSVLRQVCSRGCDAVNCLALISGSSWRCRLAPTRWKSWKSA